MVFRSALVASLVIVCAMAAAAQSFTASVDRNPVATNEQFTLEFTLSGAGTSPRNLKLPDLSKFMILSGPNQSTSMQIVNGSVSSTVSFGYVLQAREAGKFTIGAASIEANGKTLQTAPFELTVTKGSAQPRQAGRQQQPDADVKVGDNLFIRAIVDRSKVMQGEQITVTYKLYTRVNVINYAITKMPSTTGFWGEDMTPQQLQLSNETINGKAYRVGTFKKTAIFPTQSGTLQIDPVEMTCQVQMQMRRRTGDIFDDFFNDPFMGSTRTQNVNLKSEPIKITVLPLPKTNVPPSFKGAVGRFTLTSAVAKRSVKTNEPLSLKATISGTGNIKVLEAPELALPNDFEKYDPKVTESIDRNGGAISGSKTFEWLIVPRYPGAKKIPPLEFSYFDVSKNQYVTARTDEIALTVEKGSAEAAAASGLSKEDVKILNQDIRFLKSSSGTFYRRGESGVSATAAAAFMLVPLCAFIGLVVYRRKSIRESADVVTFRSRRAMKIATRRLKDAKMLLPGSDSEAFYREISRALWTYVADKLGIDRAELSIDNVTETLTEKKMQPELVGRIKECLENCEFARFAPASALQVEKQKMYDSAASIIVEIEHQLNLR